MDYLNQKTNLSYEKYIDSFSISNGIDEIVLEIEDIKKLIPILTEFVK